MNWPIDHQKANPDEWRAALSIARATGVMPSLEDDNSLDGMVDLTLASEDGLEVVEVTSSTDGEFAQTHTILRSYVDSVREMYDGEGKWLLLFGRDWEPMYRSMRNPDLAVEAMKQCERSIDRHISDGDSVTFTAPDSLGVKDFKLSLYAYPVDTPAVEYSLNAKATFKGPYILELQDFLNRSELVAKKVQKLVRESERLSATRRHLYLLIPSTGKNGHLLPLRKLNETWDSLNLPRGLDTLWLDGGTGSVARFDRESGWAFFSQ